MLLGGLALLYSFEFESIGLLKFSSEYSTRLCIVPLYPAATSSWSMLLLLAFIFFVDVLRRDLILTVGAKATYAGSGTINTSPYIWTL